LKIHLHLFIIFFISFSIKAQEAVLKNFSAKNGLPSNEVYYLHADKKGYIWICTDGGLVKYNGNSFKTFSSANGMPDNTIFEVKEDRRGRIWYRSFSGKVGYIFNDSVFTIAANKKIEGFIKDGIVSSFAIDENDNLFIGKRNSEKISFCKIASPYLSSDVEEIWINPGTAKGTDIIAIGPEDFVFSDSRGRGSIYYINLFDHNHQAIFSDSIKISENYLFTRVYRTKNTLYILLNKILKIIDVDKGSAVIKKFNDQLITAVTMDKNNILVGPKETGVLYFREANDSIPFRHLLKGLTFTYAVKDYQQGYWFSTLEAGIFYMPAQSINYLTVPDKTGGYITQSAVLNESMLALGKNNGQIVGVTENKNGSLSVAPIYEDKNKLTGTSHHILSLNNKQVILSGSQGNVLCDIYSGNVKPVFLKNNFPVPSKKITFYKDSILILGLRDIYAVSKNNPHVLNKSFESNDRLTSLEWDSVNNKIYAGGLRGLYNFYFQKKVSEKDRLLNCRIEDIKAVGGVIYIATNSEGLIIKTGNKYDTITEKMGLISNICKSLTIDNNIIWVSTFKGISKLTYGAGGVIDIHNYPLGTFVDATSVSRIRVLKDKAWFFSGQKLYSFNTKINQSDSRFYITSVFVNGHPLQVKPLIGLDHLQSNITVNYNALFFDCNTDIIYRYKISKENSMWNYTNEAKINFSNMAAGEYEFVIEAKSLKGKWIRADKTIQFIIDKPFWQKLWFIFLVASVLGVMIAFILRVRYLEILKKELAKNELRINMYKLETKAVKAQMNPHFIFNSLNSIMQFVLSKDTDNAYRYLVKFSKLVRKLLESNTSESIKLEEEIDILSRYMEIEALRFEEAFVYGIEVDSKLNLKTIEIPHMLIQPFVENAIWHGLLHKKGDKKVTITFNYLDEKRLNCIVEDNGVGREAKKQNDDTGIEKKSLAIDFIKQHLLLISKTKNIDCGFEITDKPDSSGTKITITIPVLKS